MRTPTSPPGAPPPDPHTLALVREKVRGLLLSSDAFRELPPERQRDIAYNTVQVASYLAAPEGIKANELVQKQDPYSQGMVASRAMEDSPGSIRRRSSNASPGGTFTAQGASEGARVAGALLTAVNFPSFVSGLIEGVFHAIVKSSIEQMEAYGQLVANVAKTLNQFRDENVSVNQGRDHLVDNFPDTFFMDMDTGENGGGPRVRLRDGVDEDEALKKVNSLPIEGGPLKSLDDDVIEDQLVPAARTQLATSRQQLLATMVLMGINRIVVTEGKISAKVMYDFQARDNFRFQESATRFDYGDQYKVTREGEAETESQGGDRSYNRGENGDVSYDVRDGSYYSKGKYKNTAEPVLTLASATQTNIDASLTTKASLAGSVEVNFKSDYLPLEKMADSFQIAQIQDAAKPGRTSRGPAPAGTAPAQQPAQSPAPAGTV